MIRQLSAGIDTLYWSARSAIPSARMAELMAVRERAAAVNASEFWGEVRGHALSVGPHGAHRYPVLLDCHEFRIHVTGSKNRPAVWVQLRSPFIHEVGAAAAVGASRAVAEIVAAAGLSEPRASRLDLYVDFADWTLRRDDVAGVVSHGKVTTHGRPGTDELETVMVGKSPLAVRLYRKDVEVRARGGFAPLFWNGHSGPVLRVEAQVSSEALRRLQISSVGECLACYGDVWRHATGAFVELRVPAAGDREDWSLRPEWQAVRDAGFRGFPSCGLVPDRVVHGVRAKVVPALLGYVSSYAALENISEPASALARLVSEFPGLTYSPDRRFDAEVARKRARLPSSFRLRQEGRAVGFARDRSPSPEGGDSEIATVGDDA